MTAQWGVADTAGDRVMAERILRDERDEGQLFKALYDATIVYEYYCEEDGIEREVVDRQIVRMLIEFLVMIVSSREVMQPDELIRALRSEVKSYTVREVA